MPQRDDGQRKVDRRSFVGTSLLPAAATFAATVSAHNPLAAETGPAPATAAPEIIDSNVHLFQWPFRRLKYDTPPALIDKLRRHRIRQAWAGNFESLLHTQLDAANQRLFEECQTHGAGMLVPIGSVNPAGPDWEEDLRRCQEQYRMPGVRLYPTYHGYALDHPDFTRLLKVAEQRQMLVQIVLRMEDERVHHTALSAPPVDVSPLANILADLPRVSVQLINSAGPLLRNSLEELVRTTRVTFDIAATEGNGGVGRLINGTNPSYRGAIPVDRLLFGSHAPFFPCESAVMKLFESPLTLQQLQPLMHGNAERLLSSTQHGS